MDPILRFILESHNDKRFDFRAVIVCLYISFTSSLVPRALPSAVAGDYWIGVRPSVRLSVLVKNEEFEHNLLNLDDLLSTSYEQAFE